MKLPTLNQFYESLYLKVFVNIVVGHSKSTVYVEMINNSGEVDSSSKEIFDAPYLTPAMHEYIDSFTKESPFFYISILDSTTSQGAIPTCNKQDISNFYDISTSEYKCYDDKWIYFTNKSDVYDMQRAYEKIGIDYIFSPFIVLANFFDDKINTYLAMFILVEDDSLSLSVFDASKLLYAEHLDMNIETDEGEELMLDVELDDDVELDEDDEDSIDLDDIDALDDIDELDDFGDIADLDSIEEINEFSETQDVEEELLEQAEEEEELEDDSSGFNEDYQRFSLIQSSVNRYYKNEKFESQFIENVYIADSVGVSGDLKKYLEEEMFLNVYVRHVELASEVCEIAKMELS
ncbi:hypothetical protein [Sulfurimonas sp.]